MLISVMNADDVNFAVSMTDIEGWGNVAADFERLIHFESEGCFVARIQDTRVGMITTTSYGDYAFMGSLIIKEEYRHRGIGEALMRHAMSYLHDRNVENIELDATFQGAPLYRKLGFKDKYLSLRLRRSASSSQVEIPHNPPYTVKDILDFDKKMTRLNRQKILSRLIDEFKDSVYLSGDGKINGYALVYPRADNFRAIGPILAESDQAAQGLINDIVHKNGHFNLGLGLPETARNLTTVLLKNEFKYQAPSLRMYHGQRRDYESAIYAIVSPEKG